MSEPRKPQVTDAWRNAPATPTMASGEDYYVPPWIVTHCVPPGHQRRVTESIVDAPTAYEARKMIRTQYPRTRVLQVRSLDAEDDEDDE